MPKQRLQSSTCADSIYARYIAADVVVPYGVLNYRSYLRNLALHCLAIPVVWHDLMKSTKKSVVMKAQVMHFCLN